MPGGVPIAGVATKRVAAQASEVAMKPIAVVRANTLYDPDCDAKKLAGTKSATMGKRPGTTKVSFCVDESGRVVDVKTAKAFPSDPGVDKICRETVSTWRFRPLMVGGKPQKTCSVVAFDIVFE
jgi:TonB family protein